MHYTLRKSWKDQFTLHSLSKSKYVSNQIITGYDDVNCVTDNDDDGDEETKNVRLTTFNFSVKTRY